MKYLLLWLVLSLWAEFYLIGQVMGWLGVLSTLLLLVLMVVVGSRLAKREGLATLGTLASKLQAGLPVGQDIMEGGLLLLAGFLFVFPGFISDIVAIFLLFSPVRRLFALFLGRFFLKKSSFSQAGERIIEGEVIQEAEPVSPNLAIPPPGEEPPRLG